MFGSVWILIIFIIIGVLILSGYFIYQMINDRRFVHAQDWVMFKVSNPKEVLKQDETIQNREQEWKEKLSVAEQFIGSFSGLYVSGLFKYKLEHIKKMILGQDWVSCEIIAKDGEIFFYIGCHEHNKRYVLKQIYSFYPYALIEETRDYKVFMENGSYTFESLKLTKNFCYPIKTYRSLESDPLNALTNIMGKIDRDDRAGIQILIRPNSGQWHESCSQVISQIREGETGVTGANIVNKGLQAVTSSLQGNKDDKLSRMDRPINTIQEELMKSVREKGSKIGFDCQIRIIGVSKTEQESQMIVKNIVQAFSQYTSPEGNKFTSMTIMDKKRLSIRFILREFSRAYSILNTEELASIFHFPNKFTDTPNIHWQMAKVLAPPSNLPQEGVIIGKSLYRGDEKMVHILNEDRRRHMFMIGKTGVGKTTLFINMIEQDIKSGKGCCFIDPLGDAIETILKLIPKERAEDVILFDPSDIERPMGLNLLEWERPEDRDFLVAEWLEIFYKLFDPNKTGIVGPQFEHWGRNAALTVMSQPGGGSLLEVPQLFTDDAFRDQCIANVKDPVVLSFWEKQLAKTADFHKSEMFNYFISKFGRFMTNDLMRNIIGQRKSSFNFRKVMDEGKILLINLSKGKIGETNSSLLGMILVSKIQVAAFARADMPEEKRKDFYLYIDEFQNFTTDTFKTILSEARKYHLCLNITNQYIAQLTEDIRDAVVGNAGTLLSYRIGAGDAEFMEKEFSGVTQQDLTNLPFANMYIKLLINGTPTLPFSMQGIKTDSELNDELGKSIKQLSRLKYGRNRTEIEADFKQRITVNEVGLDDDVLPPREAR